MLIVFFVVIFLLMVIFFQFKVRMAGHINLLEMKLYYCFKFLKFKFLCGKAEVDGFGKIKVENANNIFSKEIDKSFAQVVAKEMLGEINVKKIEIFFTGGLEEDSYASALICGSVTSLVHSIYGYLSQQYDNVKLYEDINPTFLESNLELTFDAVISLSLFQIFVSLIKSKIKTTKLKEQENER